jgi:hypothetical protein
VTDPEDSVVLGADPVDVVEQRRHVDEDNAADDRERPAPLEADPVDAAEQNQSVDLDDDDYRDG